MPEGNGRKDLKDVLSKLIQRVVIRWQNKESITRVYAC
jgi:hypothetical protein